MDKDMPDSLRYGLIQGLDFRQWRYENGKLNQRIIDLQDIFDFSQADKTKENTMGRYFDGIRMEDEIWTFREGRCKVVSIINGTQFCAGTYWYDFDGHGATARGEQMAFWSKPIFVAPEKPKRMVKKEGWMVVDAYNVGLRAWSTGYLYKTRQEVVDQWGDSKKIAHVTWEEQE